MSIHTLKISYQDRPLRITLGWDRPTQGFFMTLLYLDGQPAFPELANLDEDDDEFNDEPWLYHNMFDLELGGRQPSNLDYFNSKLGEFSISIPEAMIAAVLQDAQSNAGNRVVEHCLEPKSSNLGA